MNQALLRQVSKCARRAQTTPSSAPTTLQIPHRSKCMKCYAESYECTKRSRRTKSSEHSKYTDERTIQVLLHERSKYTVAPATPTSALHLTEIANYSKSH